MKCFVLLVIFAIVQYQGVIGSSSFFTEKEDLIQCKFNTDLNQDIQKIVSEFPDYERFTFIYTNTLVKTKIHISNLMKSQANLMNLYYRNTLNDFKEMVTKVNDIIKMNTQDQSTIEKITSDVTNTAQTASVPDKVDKFKQQSTTVGNDEKKDFLKVLSTLIF